MNMTTIDNVQKGVNDLAAYAYESIKGYQDEEAKASQEIEEGYRGYQEAADTLKGKRNAVASTVRQRTMALRESLETLKEKELNKLSQSEVSVTQDMVAELDMLERTIQKGEDISKYVEKYKNTPLAYKRLQQIASEKGTAIKSDDAFPPNKAEYLDTVINSIDNNLDYLNQLNFHKSSGGGFGGITLDMKYSGVLDETKRHVERYKSL